MNVVLSFEMSLLLSLALASLAACSIGFAAAPSQVTGAWRELETSARLSPVDANTDPQLNPDDANHGRAW